jgi:serine/threonine protein kinase
LLHQLLTGVEHVHSFGYVHRNIKPAQILISKKKGSQKEDRGEEEVEEELRLCGFSHAVLLQNGGVWESTEQLESGTLWYRAPESLLGDVVTTKAVDIWAVGAVFCEMLIGYPCFSGSPTEIGTLWNIFKLQGVPTEDTWPGVSSVG